MERSVHREIPQKLYVQLSEIIRRKIENKEWGVGFKIPTEEDLCKTYGISRATVRTAISELVKHGYLVRQQGRGTFVGKKVISDELSMLTNFREQLLEADIDFSTEVLAQTTIMPVDDLNIKLDIPAHEHILYLKRLRSIDNKPILIQETYIPVSVCPKLIDDNVKDNSLFVLFEKKYGIPVTQVRSYFDIVSLNDEEGRIFDLPAGSPAVLLDQYFFSWKTHIMYSRSIAKPGKFKFSIEFDKTQ